MYLRLCPVVIAAFVSSITRWTAALASFVSVSQSSVTALGQRLPLKVLVKTGHG